MSKRRPGKKWLKLRAELHAQLAAEIASDHAGGAGADDFSNYEPLPPGLDQLPPHMVKEIDDGPRRKPPHWWLEH